MSALTGSRCTASWSSFASTRVVVGFLVAAIALAVGAVLGAAATSVGQSTQATAVINRADSSSFVPECPHPTYSPDGNVTPLFCKIDNPVALRFYRPIAPKLFRSARTQHRTKSSRPSQPR